MSPLGWPGAGWGEAGWGAGRVGADIASSPHRGQARELSTDPPTVRHTRCAVSILARMSLTEPTVLRATNTADFLATVPASTGFTARNSIVVIPFVGKRTHGAFRMDLPVSSSTRDFRTIGTWIADTLGGLLRVTGAPIDGVAVVVYTDASFAERRGIPHLELWRAIEPKLRRAGLVIKDAACVASDGWASYVDPRRPQGGHPLSEITESRAALEAAFHSDRIPDVSDWRTLPAADPELARRVSAGITELLLYGDRTDAFGIPREVSFDAVELGEQLIEKHRAGAAITPGMLAELNLIAQAPAARDVLLVTLAGGRERGEATLRDQLDGLERQEETGETFDDMARERLDSSSDDDLFIVGRSRVRPDEQRLIEAIEVLRHAAAHAPASRRAGTLCILAWMLWAHGTVSAATRMHELAAECDPELLMVETLGWLLESGYPAWALRARGPVQS